MNNIAWLVCKSPMFPMFGDGRYRVQPVFVDDVGRIAVESAESPSNLTVDASGPEIFAFEGFVRLIMEAVNPSMKIIRLPPIVGLTIDKLIGWKMKDVILTRDELQGLMDELLTSAQTPNGTMKFSEWLTANKKTVGNEYTSELCAAFLLIGRQRQCLGLIELARCGLELSR